MPRSMSLGLRTGQQPPRWSRLLKWRSPMGSLSRTAGRTQQHRQSCRTSLCQQSLSLAGESDAAALATACQQPKGAWEAAVHYALAVTRLVASRTQRFSKLCLRQILVGSPSCGRRQGGAGPKYRPHPLDGQSGWRRLCGRRSAAVAGVQMKGICAGDDPDQIKACLWRVDPVPKDAPKEEPKYQIMF